MKTIKGDKNMTNQNKTQETIKNLEADILEGGLTDEERREAKKEIKALKKTIQTWPWDTIILMNIGNDKDLTIPGTDIEVIYDRENKVYRRK
tara:strand:- start:2348 stop:2623 length:276 start_codon:yes stop_codon:yes gene_type:complete